MTENKLSESEIQEIREEAEKVFPLPDDKLRGTHSYRLAANQIQGLRDAHFDGQVAALTRERERVNIMVEALEKISEDYYPESVFSPISEDEWDEVVEYLAKGGYKIDSISGHYGRIFHKMHRDIAQTALNNYKYNK